MRWVSLGGLAFQFAALADLQPSAPDAAAVRAAIVDLQGTFGQRYPRGQEFAVRLAKLEDRQASTRSEEEKRRDLEQLIHLQQEALYSNPLLANQPLLFVVRHQYPRDHHNTATFFPKARTEYNDGHFVGGGALKVIDWARGKTVRALLDYPDGVVRDPEVHFDGQRILFSLRTSANDSYHLYEVGIDGGELRQLTFAEDVDDLDPIYLPGGDIVFSSTREPKYCMCNRHIMANLFRMESDGANIHQIGKSTLFEGHASLLPDGRLLYDRWEYVDRNFGDAQALWVSNPDGTGHAVYWGNNTPSPGGVIDARAIPNTSLAMAILGSCHDRPWGALAILDRRGGLDGRDPVLRTWPAEAVDLIGKGDWDTFMQVPLKYEDPFPLFDPNHPESAGKYFLCSRMTGQDEQTGIYLIDVFGNEVLIHSEEPGCFDPMPLRASPPPLVIPDRRSFMADTGYFYLQDVYRGTHMAGVPRGSVKWLRVVEVPEKKYWTKPTWGGQGIEGPAMNWHDFNNKRLLGRAPVEADGSAYFAVPAETFVYFQLLDEQGMMVQSMRSGTLVQGGEQQGCVGCHEDRRESPSTASYPIALRRAPSRLETWRGEPRLFSYAQEVQPVFDRHCVRCHDYDRPAGQVLNLAGDRDLVFNTSYNELWRKGYVKAIGAGPAALQPADSWGSRHSLLLRKRCGEARDVHLSPADLDRLVTWIDLNAPYYPVYASAYPENLAGRSPLTPAEVNRLAELTGIPFAQLAEHNRNQGPQVTFDRPHLSPCLRSINDPSSPRYSEALALIRVGQDRLTRRPESDRPGFTPCPMDQWRDQNYANRQTIERMNRQAILDGRQYYEQRP